MTRRLAFDFGLYLSILNAQKKKKKNDEKEDEMCISPTEKFQSPPPLPLPGEGCDPVVL